MLLVMVCSFVRVFLGRPRYARRPTAAPTEPGTGPAMLRPRPAARGAGRRPAAAPPGAPRQAPPPAAPEDVARPPGERSAAAPPAHRRSPDQQAASVAASAGSRPPVLAEQLPCPLMYQDGYVTVKVHAVVAAGFPRAGPNDIECGQPSRMWTRPTVIHRPRRCSLDERYWRPFLVGEGACGQQPGHGRNHGPLAVGITLRTVMT
jgi:hypothetical protein